MKTFVKDTKKRVYLKIGNVIYSTNHDWSNQDFNIIDLTTVNDQQLNSLKSESGWSLIGDFNDVNEAYNTYIGILKTASEQRKEEQKIKDSLLNDFWKDVDSRIGMDVCTPFIKRFVGNSFVAYDKGFVWSKTLKTIFKLRNFSGSRAYYPKAYKKVYSFGSDLSELDKNQL